MHRFYADESGIHDGVAQLNAEDTAHALRVLRLHSGDPVELLYNGQRYAAVLEQTGTGLQARISSSLPSTEPGLEITLYQGLPKAEKMEMIVQKATELGAVKVVPVAMNRSIVKLDSKDVQHKTERWQKIIREACKQSGRCRIPEITLPVTVKQLPSLFSCHDTVIVPWEACEGHGPGWFHSTHAGIHSLGILIGPEGGISTEEITFFQENGCIPITLGPRILRTETAGLAAITAMLCLYGEMENT